MRRGIRGRAVELTAVVSDCAFEALRAGRLAEHYEMVVADAHKLAATVDVLVLAQASMARVIDALPAGTIGIPVFPFALSTEMPATAHG